MNKPTEVILKRIKQESKFVPTEEGIRRTVPSILLFTFLLLFSQSFATAQVVNIPDANFKAALVADTAINTNGDGEIQVSEAIAFSDSIDFSSLGISDLKGIEAFTALTDLNCRKNFLPSLDVSNNTALTYLDCSWNDMRRRSECY